MGRHCRKLNDMSYCSEYGLTTPVCGHKITVLAICSCKESERKFFHDAPLYEVTLVFSATDIGVWQLYTSKQFGQRKLSQADMEHRERVLRSAPQVWCVLRAGQGVEPVLPPDLKGESRWVTI